MKHAHAELLHRLADDCELAVWVWDASMDYWCGALIATLINDCSGKYHYALGDKPISPPKKYAMVEGVKVPMTHLTVAPEKDAPYWYINSCGVTMRLSWAEDKFDFVALQALSCYATEADAQEAATAKAQVWKIAFERAK